MEIINYISDQGLVTILLSGLISFIMTKIQLKSNEKNINKQIELEISKLRMQHLHERTSANRNYLNKIFFENVFNLRSNLIEYCRLEGKISRDVYTILKNESLDSQEKIKAINERMAKYNSSYAIEKSEVDILFIYVPELENQWRDFSVHCTKMNFVIVETLLEKLRNNEYMPEDTELFKNEIDIFTTLASKLMDDLRDYTRDIIIKLKATDLCGND